MPLTIDLTTRTEAEKVLYVDVALGMPQDEPFQYEVPVRLRDQIAVGRRVKVPIRNQTRIGYIVGVSDAAQVAACNHRRWA